MAEPGMSPGALRSVGQGAERAGGSGAGRRELCPTCRARRTGAASCHRCGADLGMLLAVEQRADRLYAEARAAYARGRFRAALKPARAAVRLEASSRNLALLAAASLRCGRFASSVRAARAALRAQGQ